VQEIARKSMTTATETDPFSLADTSHVNNQRHMKRATKSAMIHSTKTKDDLVKTAMWLTRSETLLSKDIVESSRTSKKDIENEMKSIAILFHHVLVSCKMESKDNYHAQTLQQSVPIVLGSLNQ
jgi:hypothetical protein